MAAINLRHFRRMGTGNNRIKNLFFIFISTIFDENVRRAQGSLECIPALNETLQFKIKYEWKDVVFKILDGNKSNSFNWFSVGKKLSRFILIYFTRFYSNYKTRSKGNIIARTIASKR